MASNPMQRKSRNSFLLGAIVGLLVMGVATALLFIQLKEKTEQLNAELSAKVNVYTLTQNVKSGQVLTQDMFQLKKIHKDSIPSNATSVPTVIESWFLQTKEGEMVSTDKYKEHYNGIYLDRDIENNNGIIEVITNEGKAFEDSEGEKIETGDTFTFVNGVVEKVDPSDKNLVQDEYGAYYLDKDNKDAKTRVWMEDATGEYYIYKLEKNELTTGNTARRIKEYITMKEIPVLAKVSMNANTVVTPYLVTQSDEVVTDDVRQQEYNMIVLPVDLMTDDYIDIRLMTPAGQDFIVVSKAKVDVPMNADDTYVSDTIRVNLREDEILAMSSAIVEAYGLLGSKLYATKYVEAGMQEPSSPTYTPNAAVTAQINNNPNIVAMAQKELATRYSASAKASRNEYLQSLIDGAQDYDANVNTNTLQDITNANAARKKYLESLNY